MKKITQTGANFGNKFNFEYEYDSRGNITAETRGGLKTTYAYDALGQLISVNDPHENVVWYYKYDCGGNILEKKKYHRKNDGSVGALLETIPYEYGDPNWKDKLTKYNGKTITYDDIGNPKDDGDRTYEWEAGRRLKKVTVKWKPEDGIEDGCHAETGTILKIEFSNTNLLDADVTSTVASAHVYNGGVEITSQYAESYFEWKRDTGNSSADSTWNSAHKGMKSVTIKKAELTKNTQFTCILTKIQPTCGDIVVDEDGNLLYAASENGDVFFLDEDGYLCVENPKNSYKFDGADLSMDTTTSLGTVSATSWVYTARGSDKIVEFKYNSEGLRIQKDVTTDGVKTTTKYILNGKLLAELNCGNDVLKFDYDDQGLPTKVNWNGSVYAYVHNLQGDIVGILDNAGALVVEYMYDTWGKLLSSTSSLADTLGKRNPFRYRGYVYDEESGLYYLRSRYYNPMWGRFMNADALLGDIGQAYSHNIFAYGINTPVKVSDPDGQSIISAIAGVVGAVVRAIVGAVVYVAKKTSTAARSSSAKKTSDAIDITEKLNTAMQENYEYMNNYLAENTKRYGAVIAYAMANIEFAKKVKTGGDWDFKSSWNLDRNQVYLFNGIEITYQDPGNIHYGYVGSALHGLNDLRIAAGLYQIVSKTSDISYCLTCFDDPDDYAAITYGYLLKHGTYSTILMTYSLNP